MFCVHETSKMVDRCFNVLERLSGEVIVRDHLIRSTIHIIVLG